MKIDFSKKLVDEKGEELVNPAKEKVSFKEACSIALLNGNDRDQSPEEKYKCYQIWVKISKPENEIELSIEEIALMKKKVGISWSPLMMGRIWDALEEKKEEKSA